MCCWLVRDRLTLVRVSSVRSMGIDNSGKYLVTAGADRKVKVRCCSAH
jgi:hypothetical protein